MKEREFDNILRKLNQGIRKKPIRKCRELIFKNKTTIFKENKNEFSSLGKAKNHSFDYVKANQKNYLELALNLENMKMEVDEIDLN